MSYLSRPVFECPIQWVGPSQSVTYDLRPITVGFGADEFAPVAPQVTRGWRCKFWRRTAEEIQAYEEWSAALKGRLNGFWWPEPKLAAVVISTTSAGVFNVKACGLVDVWDEESELHVWLVDPSGNGTAAKVTAVTTPSAGVERITVNVSVSPAAGWLLHRLLYVRQAQDVEVAEMLGEHFEEREISVVELPEEYAAAETGDEPIWLYKFSSTPPGESTRYWYYTSFAAGVTSGGHSYAPLAITHQGITLSMVATEQVARIETVLASTAPWTEMVAEIPEHPLSVVISKAPYATPSSAEVLFSGPVKEITITGRRVSITATSWMDGAGRIPSRLLGAGCPFDLYAAATCGVDPADFTTAVEFEVLDGIFVTVSGVDLVAQPAHTWRRGTLDTGSGATRETRMILDSSAVGSGRVALTLTRPLLEAVVGGSASIRLGCSRTRGDCASKFDNLVNYGGFDFTPRDNPVMKGPDVSGNGGKK